MKKIYEVSFRGMWLGGFAVVKANSEEEALNIVEAKYRKLREPEEQAKVFLVPDDEAVLYFQNGDY